MLKRRFTYTLFILVLVLLVGAGCSSNSAERDHQFFEGENEFSESASYIVDGAYWEISFGDKNIDWGNDISIPNDAGYIGLFRQTMPIFLKGYGLNLLSYGQVNTFSVPNPADKYMAIYIRSSTFKIDSFKFIKNDKVIGTLGAYPEAELAESTTNYDSSIDADIYKEPDHNFAQLGTGSDSIDSCIVYKFSKDADFDEIQMVIVP
ncbi:MAG: hypothetical protein HQ525_00755 [Anaerolineae bacterium]|nr:hypothetical protein [Anaerolineae bacterium]